jgi:Tol biopolymer transport system component/tRNA A-37 threonylcarbamoyl transferase component Bud32
VTDPSARLSAALADRYAIERELGQGGMATVYLAEDLKHHRKVALKVLRPEIAVTVGAGRFSREIEVAARLQHPNILPLLDSGEAEGFFFYVMPYVEGESLRDRLARGGELPIPDAVRILMEVADALSEAHAHGVVHRDIKPDNVMLRGRHALVADFGVAKAVTEATGQQLLTSTGVALGTPTYMAPEQAMADPHQDHRVDIYALGVLGYELLTGRAPFSATTAQEMLAAHVTAVPEPVEKYRTSVSPALAAVVMKCLAKKPADRWQTAEEVLQHLEPLATPSGGTTPTQTAPTKAVERLPRWAKWTAGAAAVVIVALIAMQVFRSRPLIITASDLTPVTNDPGVEFQPAISPSGDEVAYVAGPIGLPRLFVRSTVNVTRGGAVRLGDTAVASEWLPSWTPDGQQVRFWGCRGTLGFSVLTPCVLRETGKLGGPVGTVTAPPGATRLAWSPDEARVAFVKRDTLYVGSADGSGSNRPADVRPELHSPSFSPDGKRLAYVEGNSGWRVSGNLAPSRIWVVNSDGGEPRQVTAYDHLNVSPVWLDPQHLLFVSDRDGQRAVYAVEVGPEGPRGEPRAIAGIADPHSISYSAGSRRLAYAKFSLRQNIWSFPLKRSAPISIWDGRPVTTGTQVVETLEASPDGQWIAFSSNLRPGLRDVYKMPVDGGQAVLLTSGPAGGEWPTWSPDGREIAFYTVVPEGQSQVAVIPADGGPPVTLTSGAFMHAWPRWSAAGLDILYLSNPSGRYGLWRVSRDSLRGPWHEGVEVAVGGGCPAGIPEMSPDGRGILCTVGSALEFRTPDRRVLWRRDLAVTGRLTGITNPQYSRDGRTAYLVGTRDGRRGIWAVPLPVGEPRLVVAFDDPALSWYNFAVGPDRLYLVLSEYESDIWVARLKY